MLAEIKGKGSEIVVGEYLEPPTRCSGGVPTVLNTDTIRVLARGGADVDLRLGGGPLAPGASPESEGAPEIEIEYSGGFALRTVVGTRRADELQWGPGGAHAGLNLNPGDAGDQDVDVTARGLAFLSAHGGAGNDTIGPGPAQAQSAGSTPRTVVQETISLSHPGTPMARSRADRVTTCSPAVACPTSSAGAPETTTSQGAEATI